MKEIVVRALGGLQFRLPRFFIKYFSKQDVWVLEERDADGNDKVYASKNLKELLEIIEAKYL